MSVVGKSVRGNARNLNEIRRAILQLQKSDANLSTTANTDITTINTTISNILDGTTPVPGSAVSATDKASLPASSDGTMGYTTGATKRGYMRINSTWFCITHLES